jgi:hypothetical protein|tara:strand:+ start:1014 stop:1268 length:255 start_codon:yes stop_codon:yes gene_type:complete
MKGGDLLAIMGGGKRRRNKTGKRKARKSRRGKKRTMKGGSMVTNALLPFGLLTLQQFFQNKTRNNKKGLTNGLKSVRKSMKVKF